MPAGVDVAVEDGFATIAFVDPSLRGPGLAALFAAGTPPELVEKVTRPRVAYTAPEGYARLAGLLDEVPPFADGGVILGPSTPSDDSVPVLLDPGHIVPAGDGSAPLDAIIGTAEIPAGEPVPEPVFAEGGPLPEGPLPVLGTSGEDVLPKVWPEGEPELDWKRPELDAYAASKGIDTRELSNKRDVLAAITKAAE